MPTNRNLSVPTPAAVVKTALAVGLCAVIGSTGVSNRATAGSSASQVKALQIEELGTATRIIVPWSAPPSELKVDDPAGKPMNVSFPGTMPGLDKGTTKKFNWPNLSHLYIRNHEGRVELAIKRTQRGTAVVKAGLSRMIIDVPHDYDRMFGAKPVAPGVRHMGLVEKTAAGPVQIHVLEIDPRHPDVEVRPALAVDRLGGKAAVGRIVSSHQALAGINGSFFKPDTGMPLGILMINQELISGPIYNRVALGIGADSSLSMAQVHLVGDATATDDFGHLIRVPLNNVNQPRVRFNEAVVYTNRWGATAPKVPQNGMQIQLVQNRVTAVSTKTPLAIPRSGMVISGPSSPGMLALSNLRPSQPIRIGVYTVPDWSNMKQAISGGPWLVRSGQPYIDLTAQHFSSRSLGTREPRTAAGISKNGRLLLVTVDGRHPKVSVGMTLPELSRLMARLGATQAMNLDGGSSTQMAIGGQTVNIPSSGKIGVSNSLLVRRSPGSSVATNTVPSAY